MDYFKFVPFDQRKKGLLLSDDIRMPSGIGTMSKEIIVKTIHHFNWVQLGGAITHPDKGQIIQMEDEMKKLSGVEESYMRIYPIDGYGDPDMLRSLIEKENPDFILHFTDPRFWTWLYQIEHEIRQQIPILFYHIWDDLPFPRYNENFYESCDWLGCISKQTYNIVKNVRLNLPIKKWELSYLPHGIDHKIFRPISADNPGKSVEIEKDGKKETITEYSDMLKFREKILNYHDIDFVLFYNSRNIRRKMPGDVILAFKTFWDKLDKEKREKVVLLMHTHVVDNNGTDLLEVANVIAPDCKVLFSTQKLEAYQLNYLCNIADVTINMASNEGFGLTTAESLMAGTPIISNVTGGLQDQHGWKDKEGNYLDVDEHLNSEWGSNHDGRYRKHGKWAMPLFPTNRALVGSPPTPYIFDDRCCWKDAAKKIMQMYKLSTKERKRRGMLGRKFMMSEETQMTSEMMGNNFIKDIETVFENWKPRKRFTLIKTGMGRNKALPSGITL